MRIAGRIPVFILRIAIFTHLRTIRATAEGPAVVAQVSIRLFVRASIASLMLIAVWIRASILRIAIFTHLHTIRVTADPVVVAQASIRLFVRDLIASLMLVAGRIQG
jgi:hypothetical protein